MSKWSKVVAVLQDIVGLLHSEKDTSVQGISCLLHEVISLSVANSFHVAST